MYPLKNKLNKTILEEIWISHILYLAFYLIHAIQSLMKHEICNENISIISMINEKVPNLSVYSSAKKCIGVADKIFIKEGSVYEDFYILFW